MLLRLLIFAFGVTMLVLFSCRRENELSDSNNGLKNLFNHDFSSSVELLEKEKHLVDTIAGFKKHKREILSVVFPEIIKSYPFNST